MEAAVGERCVLSRADAARVLSINGKGRRAADFDPMQATARTGAGCALVFAGLASRKRFTQ